MSRYRHFSAFSLFACGALLALALSAAAGSAGTRLEGRLQGLAPQQLASGKAKYESRDGRTRLSVQVEDTRGVTRIDVVIDGIAVGSAAIDPLSGKFDLNLDTANRQAVPMLAAGAFVEVMDHATGAVILDGTLAAK